MKKRRMSDHATWIVGTMALLLSLVAGCGNREVMEIRADFEKIPDFFLGKRSGGQNFVRYTYSRIGDIPDERLRLQLLREFTDRLLSFDFKKYCPLENLGWRERQDTAEIVANALWLLNNVSEDAKSRLMSFNIPLVECWEVKFRCLEKDRAYREWVVQVLKQTPHLGSYDLKVYSIEQDILSDRDNGRLSPDDFATVRARLEQILGRPMRTKEQLEADRWRHE